MQKIFWIKMIIKNQIHILCKYDFTIKLMGSRKKALTAFCLSEFLCIRVRNQVNRCKTSNDRVRNNGKCKEIMGQYSS